MNIRYKKSLITIISTLSIFVMSNIAKAANVMSKVSGQCKSNGDCSVNDFLQIGIGISELILGVVGSLALLAFIYGGVLWLISGGSSDKIAKGKQAIIGAVIGLVIVFFSYTIIFFVAKALGVEEDIFTTGWFKVPSG